MNYKQIRDNEFRQAEIFSYHEEGDYLAQTIEQVKTNPVFLFYVDNDELRRHMEEEEIDPYVEELHQVAYASFSEKYGPELTLRFQQAFVACALLELRRCWFEPYLKIAWIFTPEACSEDVRSTIEKSIPNF